MNRADTPRGRIELRVRRVGSKWYAHATTHYGNEPGQSYISPPCKFRDDAKRAANIVAGVVKEHLLAAAPAFELSIVWPEEASVN